MRRVLVALSFACVVVVLGGSAAAAAPGAKAGAYASFTSTAMTLATGFPSATITSTDPAIAGGSSATLPASSVFGTVYGSSSGRTHLSLHPVSGVTPSVTTITFASPTPVGGWSLALGDVDADTVQLSGLDAAGLPITGAALGEQGAFNFSPAGTDLPVWDATTSTLRGNVLNTDGASDWFTPTVSLSSLTFTVTRQSGLPVVYLWMAATTASLAGVVTDPAGAPVPGATVTLTDPAGGTPPGGTATQVSAADGSFEFATVFPSDVALTATAPGFAPGALTAVSPTGGAYPSIVTAATGGSTLPQLAASGDDGARSLAAGLGAGALGVMLVLWRRRLTAAAEAQL